MSARSLQRRPALRERVREATATAILEAAEEVAVRRGLEATSIAAIAAHAGVAVGTLYNYFPDRDALLVALFQMRRAQLIPQIETVAEAARALPFEQRLRAVVTGTFEVLERARRFCTLAMNDPHMVKLKAKPALQPALVTALVDVLRPVSGSASVDQANMIYGAIKQLLALRIEHDERLAPAAPILVDTFLRGIKKK